MNRGRAIVLLSAIALAIAAVVFLRKSSAPASLAPKPVVETIPPGIVVSESAIAAPPASPTGMNAPGDTLLAGYADPSHSPQADLAMIKQVIGNFLIINKQATERPLSANEEWSAALRGKRPGSESWLSGRPPVFDSGMRLIDRWGTPLHFHAMGARRWEIRSAGPDRKLWTADDLLENLAG